MALTIDTTDAQILDDEQILAKVQAALVAVADAGQSYTLFGSRTVTKADTADLERLEIMYRNRLLAKAGETGIHQLDHRGQDC